jgi:L-threonylcarbamoyladenylate synthase
MPSPFRIRQAVRLLESGGVLAYPTEAVYGLGCDPLDYHAVQRLLRLKHRSIDKGLILIAAELGQLLEFVRVPDRRVESQLQTHWPGPVTFVLPAAPRCPRWLTGGRETLAVRVTDHPLAARLCRGFAGPLVSTSANRAGRPPARTALQVRLRCPGVDAILSGPLGRLDRPTEIRDPNSGKVIRPGG